MADTASTTKVIAPRESHQVVKPDGGWGWVVIVASSIVMMLVTGMQKSYGIYMLDIKDRLKIDTTKASLVQGVGIASAFLVGPFTSVMIKSLGHRMITIIGGVVASLGLFLGYFSYNLWMLVLAIGILNGVGNGMLNIVAFAVANEYFDKRAATACGIILGFSGIGGFIAPFLNQWLVQEYSYTGALLINSALMFHAVACAAIYRPLTPPDPQFPAELPMNASTNELLEYQELQGAARSPDANSRSTASSTRSVATTTTSGSAERPSSAFAWEICCNARFWVYSICVMLLDVGFFNVTIYLPLRSGELGHAGAEAVAVSLFSAADAAGRLAFSTVWDTGVFRSVYARQLGHTLATCAAGIVMALTSVVDSYTLYLMWTSLFGLFVGIALSPTMAIVKDIARPERFSDALSLIFLLEGPITFISPLFLGVIYENRDDTGLVFLVMGLSMVGCSVLSTALPVLTKFYYHRKAAKPHHIENQAEEEKEEEDCEIPVESAKGFIFMTHL